MSALARGARTRCVAHGARRPSSVRRGALGLAVLVALVAPDTTARAHERSSSRSTWRLGPGGAEVTLSITARELPLLGPAADADPRFVADYVSSQLWGRTAGGRCEVDGASLRVAPAPAGRLAWQWRVRCPAGPSLVVESQLFARAAPHHLHFVRVVAPGARSAHQLLTEGRRSVELALSTAPPTTGLSAWLGLGMHHVLTGHDHLAFLLALLVGAAGLGALVWTLTGFTLGHALTLGLAALGHLRADTRLVEALIGLSIVVVCVENAWAQSVRGRAWLPVTLVAALVTGALAVPGSPRVTLAAMALSVACSFGLLTRGAPATTWRALLAGTFGLVHGLGFASALGEHALPSTELLPALLGFNLGVEAGQVLAVGLVWSALALLSARRPTLRPRALVLTNAAVCAAGVYWTLTRLG